MDVYTQQVVAGLCRSGAAGQALRLLYRVEPPASEQGLYTRVRWLRLLGDTLEANGRLRSAAAARWRALRLQRELEHEVTAADWAPVAASYRELWRTTGERRYLRWYLRFSRERTDELQTQFARHALAALRRPRQCSQRT